MSASEREGGREGGARAESARAHLAEHDRAERAGRTAHDLLEIVDAAALLEDVVQARDLDEPPHVVAEELVLDDPLGELVPLVRVSATT